MQLPRLQPSYFELNLELINPHHQAHVALLPDKPMQSDTDSYAAAVSFKIEAQQIPIPPLSYPHAWQLFYDLDLKIKTRFNRPHNLIVFAKRDGGYESLNGAVAQFYLNVTQLRRQMTFPITYSQFRATKCRIYESMNGVLKKGSVITIHYLIPGAKNVYVIVDSQWLNPEGYNDPILKRQVTVGSKDVSIYVQYEQNKSYHGHVKYSVQ
ncbi:unnamed protein product [Didymodactylos carnosus]|uniref:Uncharacterized protein n=1 Tax=Didymodactylos carnosus TaxID=1234261 RepID=A0A813RMA1_9BILA|nr:unnamed protein product [Didymodactylos carnosus]CAF3570666.1 unnamed protein product [Didymodactylos carnosus]